MFGFHYLKTLKLYQFIAIIWLCSLATLANALNVEHHLEVELLPAEHKLIGLDRMEIHTGDDEILAFRLSEKAGPVSVEINGADREFNRRQAWLHVPLESAERKATVRVTIRYAAVFDDPVPVRPVNVDNPGFGVSATISSKGSFLLAGAHWYPEVNADSAVYNLSVRAPAGNVAVTAGQSIGHSTKDGKSISNWRVDYPTEGLSLTAARYYVTEKKVGDITAATYFLTADEQLAEAYLEATAAYLEFYSDLFGPYPFRKFAVVENFFPTGYGFPSYTLLGSTVLRLPFIIHTSLGHEIAHCWWGNGVYVDYDKGNWSEALTTYVADYLYKERKSESEGRTYRQQILRNYATLVNPQKDFALARFVNRHDPVTKTIGYDKGVMVFHMLREKLGDDAFWGTLRDIFSLRRFQLTSWAELQQAFEKRSNRSLNTFFKQWVHRKGAPRFHLESVSAEPVGNKWKIRGRIVQEKPYYRFSAKMLLAGDTREQLANITVAADSVTSFEIDSEQRPQKLILDPEVNIMRRLFESEIPPAINSLKSSASILFIVTENVAPQVREAARLMVQSLGLKRYEFVSAAAVSEKQVQENDLLIIGRPHQNRFLVNMPHAVRLDHKSFSLNQKQYDQAADVFFGVFAHPSAKNRVAALFWPLSPDYAEIAARKATHYGKYSYLVFRNGQNREKGFWPIEDSPLIYRWTQRTN